MEPVAIINSNYGARSAAGGVTFQKVLRTPLHENEKYLDELTTVGPKSSSMMQRERCGRAIPAWVWGREAGRHVV